MDKQPKLLTLPFLIWVLWPVLFAFLFGNLPYGFLGYAFNEGFMIPPAIDYLTSHWLKNEPPYKSLYVNAWYANGILIGVRYICHLKDNPARWGEMGKEVSFGKKLVFMLFLMGASLVIFSGIAYLPNAELSGKLFFLIYEDLGLLFFAPILALGLIFSPIGTVVYLVLIWRDVFIRVKEN